MLYEIHEKILVELPDGGERVISDIIAFRGVTGHEQAAQWVYDHYLGAEKVRADWWEIRDGRWIFRWSVEWDRDLLSTSGGMEGSGESVLRRMKAQQDAMRKWVEHAGVQPPLEGQIIECSGDKSEYFKFVYRNGSWFLEDFAGNNTIDGPGESA